MISAVNRYVAPFVLGILAIACVLAFVPLHNLLGDLVFLPAALLVAAMGWLWGLWAGLLVGALTFPLLLLLLNLAGQPLWIGLLESHLLRHLLVGTPVMVAMGGMVGRLRELHERVHKQADELQHQALHDPLTGLPNRLLFSDRLEQALARACRCM
jgi:hypothetical protein